VCSSDLHGLYDVKVTNPDNEEVIAPYRYQVERFIEPDVTVGLGGPSVLQPGSTGTFGFSVLSTTNIDTPYVYFTYGMHHCVNVVCGRINEPIAVLIRALEPTEGLERMYEARAKANRDRDLCSGPAKLTQAMAIDRALNGVDLIADGRLFVEILRDRPIQIKQLVNTSRIGVGGAGNWAGKQLRWALAGCEHVSGRRLG